MPEQTVYSRTLQRAADKLGGVDELQRRLQVPSRLLKLCIDGKVMPPNDVFLRAVDLLNELDESLNPPAGGAQPGHGGPPTA